MVHNSILYYIVRKFLSVNRCDVTFSVRHKGRMTRPNSAVWRLESFHILGGGCICAFSRHYLRVSRVPRYRFCFLFFVYFRTESYKNWRLSRSWQIDAASQDREERRRTLSPGRTQVISFIISHFLLSSDTFYRIIFQAQDGTRIGMAR